MWFNGFISRGLIPDFLLRRGVRSQGKQRLRMMKNSDLEREYGLFLKEASAGEIAVHTDDANNQHYEVDSEFFQYCLGKNLKYSCCYWNDDTTSLDDAEDIMLDIYCKRAKIEDGMKILDVGEWWDKETNGLPVPLGINVMSNKFGNDIIKKFDTYLKNSIEFALEHDKDALEYAMQYSRGKSEELIEKFVKMYVNPVTVKMGEDGEKSIRKMFEMASEKDLVPEFEIKLSEPLD